MCNFLCESGLKYANILDGTLQRRAALAHIESLFHLEIEMPQYSTVIETLIAAAN